MVLRHRGLEKMSKSEENSSAWKFQSWSTHIYVRDKGASKIRTSGKELIKGRAEAEIHVRAKGFLMRVHHKASTCTYTPCALNLTHARCTLGQCTLVHYAHGAHMPSRSVPKSSSAPSSDLQTPSWKPLLAKPCSSDSNTLDPQKNRPRNKNHDASNGRNVCRMLGMVPWPPPESDCQIRPLQKSLTRGGDCNTFNNIMHVKCVSLLQPVMSLPRT